MNQRDLLHHETSVCELRRVQCHSCNDIKQEMNALKVKLATIDEKLEKNKKELVVKLERMEANGKRVEDVIAKVGIFREQLDQQKESNHRLETEVRKCFNEIIKLGKIVQTLPNVQAEQVRKRIAEAGGIERELKIVIAGGESKSGHLNSVEMFKLSNVTWAPLQPSRERHYASSSFVHNNQVFLIGGYVSIHGTKTIQTLSLNAVHVNQSIRWIRFAGELPSPSHGHCSVVYNGWLITIGGYDGGKGKITDSITEVSLVPPYTSKLLATMPQPRWYHSVAIFGDKIVIVGGAQDLNCATNLKTVLLYDVTKNEYQELAPLPYAVNEAATVKWGDDNVIIVGGLGSDGKPLNKVLLYNIKTQKSHKLPDIKYKRRGCVAAVVSDTVIVMGGKDEEGNYLRSVESFGFDSYTWQDLPEMHEARYLATAVVC